jgi:aspartyl-tRNA(Asn)/glutamyl-tRNA(Gln) amidotransferase subunit C
MSLTREEVEHIALLARLDLSEEEIARYQKQLSSILDHVGKLNDIDTSKVAPMASVIAGQSRLREDEPGESLTAKALLSNAPDSAQEQFRVPYIFDDDKSDGE